MDIAFHLACPAQKAPEVVALPPHKLPEFQEPDLLHLDAGVGLDAPQEIGASPRGEAVAFRRVPEEADSIPHGAIIPTKGWVVQKRKIGVAPRLDSRGGGPHMAATGCPHIRAW